jgi:hypothetical protein
VIVNVEEKCLEVQRDPDPASRRYRTLFTLAGDQAFQSATVPGYGFRVSSRSSSRRYSVSKQPRCG